MMIEIALLVYAGFGVYYGIGIYRQRIKEGNTAQEALQRAVLRALTKPAEQAGKAIWAVLREVFKFGE